MAEVKKKQKKKKDKLTPQQEKFVQNVINGLPYARAYKLAFPNTKMSEEAVCVEASNMINGTGKYKNNPKVSLRFLELNKKAEKIAEKSDEKKIATAAEILEFLTYAMNDENAEYKDRIRAAELSGKRLGIFKEQVEVSGQAPLVIIDDA